ncbi:unnamed protein product, partial [Effrenium voratum]
MATMVSTEQFRETTKAMKEDILECQRSLTAKLQDHSEIQAGLARHQAVMVEAQAEEQQKLDTMVASVQHLDELLVGAFRSTESLGEWQQSHEQTVQGLRETLLMVVKDSDRLESKVQQLHDDVQQLSVVSAASTKKSFQELGKLQASMLESQAEDRSRAEAMEASLKRLDSSLGDAVRCAQEIGRWQEAQDVKAHDFQKELSQVSEDGSKLQEGMQQQLRQIEGLSAAGVRAKQATEQLLSMQQGFSEWRDELMPTVSCLSKAQDLQTTQLDALEAQTADQRSAHQQLATLLQDQMQQLQADIANLRSEHGSFQAACLEAQEKQEQKLNTDLARIRQVEAVFESAASSEMWDPEKEGERRNSDSRFVGKLQQLPQQMDQLVHASATTLRVVQRLVCELVEPHEVEEEVRRLRAASESLLGTKEAEQWEGGQEGKRVTIQESQEVQEDYFGREGLQNPQAASLTMAAKFQRLDERSTTMEDQIAALQFLTDVHQPTEEVRQCSRSMQELQQQVGVLLLRLPALEADFAKVKASCEATEHRQKDEIEGEWLEQRKQFRRDLGDELAMLRSDLEKKLTEADEALRRDIRSMEVQRQEEQDAEEGGDLRARLEVLAERVETTSVVVRNELGRTEMAGLQDQVSALARRVELAERSLAVSSDALEEGLVCKQAQADIADRPHGQGLQELPSSELSHQRELELPKEQVPTLDGHMDSVQERHVQIASPREEETRLQKKLAELEQTAARKSQDVRELQQQVSLLARYLMTLSDPAMSTHHSAALREELVGMSLDETVREKLEVVKLTASQEKSGHSAPESSVCPADLREVHERISVLALQTAEDLQDIRQRLEHLSKDAAASADLSALAAEKEVAQEIQGQKERILKMEESVAAAERAAAWATPDHISKLLSDLRDELKSETPKMDDVQELREMLAGLSQHTTAVAESAVSARQLAAQRAELLAAMPSQEDLEELRSKLATLSEHTAALAEAAVSPAQLSAMRDELVSAMPEIVDMAGLRSLFSSLSGRATSLEKSAVALREEISSAPKATDLLSLRDELTNLRLRSVSARELEMLQEELVAAIPQICGEVFGKERQATQRRMEALESAMSASAAALRAEIWSAIPQLPEIQELRQSCGKVLKLTSSQGAELQELHAQAAELQGQAGETDRAVKTLLELEPKLRQLDEKYGTDSSKIALLFQRVDEVHGLASEQTTGLFAQKARLESLTENASNVEQEMCTLRKQVEDLASSRSRNVEPCEASPEPTEGSPGVEEMQWHLVRLKSEVFQRRCEQLQE